MNTNETEVRDDDRRAMRIVPLSTLRMTRNRVAVSSHHPAIVAERGMSEMVDWVPLRRRLGVNRMPIGWKSLHNRALVAMTEAV